jgi:hypothetical protein
MPEQAPESAQYLLPCFAGMEYHSNIMEVVRAGTRLRF